MKISDAARDVLLTLTNDNKLDGVRFFIQETCCGKSQQAGLDVFGADETPEEINGVKVVFPEEGREPFENLEIDFVNGELVILNTVCGCGNSCGGCHE